jgi:hypothetical protein
MPELSKGAMVVLTPPQFWPEEPIFTIIGFPWCFHGVRYFYSWQYPYSSRR